MPQIFPTWMTSPFFMFFLYAIAAFLVFKLIRLIYTRNWRGLRRYLGVMLIVVLVGYTLFNGYMKYLFSGFQWQMPPASIIVQTVEPRTFDDRIEAVGTTEANESSALTSNVTETVKEILFAEGQFVAAGTVIAQLHDDEEQANLVEAERAFNRSLELARTSAVSAARVDTDRARLAVAQAQIRDRQITAPFDGILGLRSISVGDIVNPGTVITTLDDVDPIKLEFSIPEAFLAAIAAGQNVEARAEAYPGVIFKGTVTAIDPRIDPVTRALRIKADIPNNEGKLRAGMLMTVNVVRNLREALAVSEEALVSQGTKKSVRAVGVPDADGMVTVEDRAVTIGARRPGYVEVLAGLQPGEKIVVDGVIKAFPGSKVKIAGEKKIDETVSRAVDNAVPGKQEDLNGMGITSSTPAATTPLGAPTPTTATE